MEKKKKKRKKKKKNKEGISQGPLRNVCSRWSSIKN
jgi:hypothetical protein